MLLYFLRLVLNRTQDKKKMNKYKFDNVININHHINILSSLYMLNWDFNGR